MTQKPKSLKIAVFYDGADPKDMVRYYREKRAQGFTTNPTLMAKAGVRDYEAFARDLLKEIKTAPISFEVFADEFSEMERQAQKIGSWGENVNVKIPITNTRGESSIPLIERLLKQGLRLNVTAVFTESQMSALEKVLRPEDDVIVSVFAGRIADTGVDPMPVMKWAVGFFQKFKNVKVLWASPREALNIYQADQCGCHIITATPDLLSKLSLHQKSLEEFSLDTVKMFFNDATKAGFQL